MFAAIRFCCKGCWVLVARKSQRSGQRRRGWSTEERVPSGKWTADRRVKEGVARNLRGRPAGCRKQSEQPGGVERAARRSGESSEAEWREQRGGVERANGNRVGRAASATSGAGCGVPAVGGTNPGPMNCHWPAHEATNWFAGPLCPYACATSSGSGLCGAATASNTVSGRSEFDLSPLSEARTRCVAVPAAHLIHH